VGYHGYHFWFDATVHPARQHLIVVTFVYGSRIAKTPRVVCSSKASVSVFEVGIGFPVFFRYSLKVGLVFGNGISKHRDIDIDSRYFSTPEASGGCVELL